MLPTPGGVGRIRPHVLRVLVLGSAASTSRIVLSRAQAGVAISADGSIWFVLNASRLARSRPMTDMPLTPEQLEASPAPPWQGAPP
jgi:hypothetical protein